MIYKGFFKQSFEVENTEKILIISFSVAGLFSTAVNSEIHWVVTKSFANLLTLQYEHTPLTFLG